MLRDEYEKLIGMLEKSNNPQEFNLEEVLKESVAFFEVLRKEFSSAPKEQRDEMIQMMTSLHSKLQEIAKQTAKDTGMTEDELTEYSENPSNFTPEQWQSVQNSRRELYDSARKFSQDLHEQRKKTGPQQDISPQKPPIRTRTARSKRQDWKKT